MCVILISCRYFADNYLSNGILESAAHMGSYLNPNGTAKNAPPSNEDMVPLSRRQSPKLTNNDLYRVVVWQLP